MSQFVPVAKLGDLRTGVPMQVHVEDRALAIYHVRGEVYATQAECPHDGEALVEGNLSDTVIRCGGEDAEFDVRDGRPLQGPAERSLDTFPVDVRGGQIFVDLEGGPARPRSGPPPWQA